MILASAISKHPTITTERLATLTKRPFDGHIFLGITNGGHAAYRAHKNVGDKIVYTKVFVTPTGTATIET
jgi:hypothetical protein